MIRTLPELRELILPLARSLVRGLASWLRFAGRQWRLVTSALVAGAIIHIALTLATAQFGASQAFLDLTRDRPFNQPFFAPRVTVENQPLAYWSAGSFYAYCPFDAARTRIEVSARLADSGWSLSLHTPRGENFYYVAGTERRETAVRLMLQPPGNVFAHGKTEISASAQPLPVINLPTKRGLIILRTPIKGTSYLRLADELRSRFSCRPERP